MIKGSVQQEDTTIISIYSPNIGAPKYVQHILTEFKGETERNTFILGEFNTPLTPKDRSTGQKISKETDPSVLLCCSLLLTDSYGTLHRKAAEHKLFSSVH